MKRHAAWLFLWSIALGAALAGCGLPFMTPRPKVVTTTGGIVIQSGIVQASTRRDGQYIKGTVSFPHAFNGDEVSVTIYPIDGAGKVAVMDADARGFTYFILATIVNIPRDDGTFSEHPQFYDGRLKWVAVGR